MFMVIYTIVALIVIIILNWTIIRGRKRRSLSQQHRDVTPDTTQPERDAHPTTHTFRLDEDDQYSAATSTRQNQSEEDAFHTTSAENDDTSLHATANQNKTARRPVNEQVADATQNYVFKKGATRGKILTAMIFGMFISILNQTLLNTALPRINTDFNISASTGQWLMTGFMLVNGILIPISAFLFNKYSYRRLFLTAMLIFTIGSLVCGFAWSFSIMMVGRVLQAMGAGVLMPLGTNVFMTIFPPEKRGMAMGTMGIAMILAPAIGPTLSGYIIENYDWHTMFFGMFIVGIISLALAFVWFGIYQKTTNPKADIPGIIFSTIGFGALLYGFSEAGNDGWTSTKIVIMFIIGISFTVAFVVREMTMKAPMLSFEVLKYSGFTLTAVINMILTMSLFGGMILLPLYLQSLRGFSALDSGLLLLPGALIMGVMGPIAGKLLDTIGIKPITIIGLAITTYGTWELTQLTMDTPYRSILMIYIIRSFGMSFVMMPIMTAGMNALPSRLISHGNALVNTMRQLAGSIGTAILVTVMTQQTESHLATFQQDLDRTDPTIQDSLQALAQQLGGQEQAMGAIIKFVNQLASVDGVNSAFWVATALSGLALILSFFLKGKSHYISNE
ncbi:DHA2 family efflux MFS transporter permease subunit [Staphylococcus pseudintermedius]|uniref:DHA2 family efflux MFS transporter permease subunit n=1 Tax=Staphylococcus pseudintermedius TaxID=283734 RepID=UPI001032E656|nr:DHA2 family efflux MFS transporter permease subunit [Staphylococcus pseudintermedius]EGQ4043830.1 DHA2 family efflux MFS transporter permease subunit [Staphylococcus pseudintermedius]EHV5272662.1 DHA2 family efflux MFS transporter permease subunit [Staphylococcus pseudintermedius]EJO7180820.1 DHA2 family efflux MFS transporter permease subunit [Staphylococcus pseudintermedius]ELK4518358.1 DHA2 family efflux MFS transporter permease subunit [Staphylococcus pseudintermedius]EMC0295906.1 DHA2 